MIYGLLILIVSLVIMDMVLKGCIEYRKWKKEELKLEKELARAEETKRKMREAAEMSIEEVKQLVEDFQFWEMVQKCVKGEELDNEMQPGDGCVEVLVPCMYHECSCHESREDCCNTGVDGEDGKKYCSIKINLSKLCGVEEPTPQKKDENLLTDEELKQLSKYIIELMKANHVGEM